jgi:CRISPR-associated exonuclease Cas4
MFSESDLLPLSGLQHLLYCERQWALIHIEQQWVENGLTAQGRALHSTVDEVSDESHGGVRIVRSLPLRSLRLGISGKADVVEFPLSGGGPPRPVEYKRGRPKPGQWDEVQLCAQAFCLEEMLQVAIPKGALFYGAPKRRTVVSFDPDLRSATEQAAARMHQLHKAGATPVADYNPDRCDRCSLLAICQPRCLHVRAGATGWFDRMLRMAAHEAFKSE